MAAAAAAPDRPLIAGAVRPATIGDYTALLKPRVMSLVVFTAWVGLVASSAPMHPVTAAASILAVALGAGASGALNMWYDADIDARMVRTAARPVPSGAVPREEALSLGLILSVMSIVLMLLSANVLAALLLAFSIFFYAVIYTMWLKRWTVQNIVIGGAAGAFPPVIGWAAATGAAPIEAWSLFLIIFLWTPAHFWALSLWASDDYRRAGVPMMPVVRGAAETRRLILVYAVLAAGAGVAPVALGFAGPAYLVTSVILGAGFITLAAWLAHARSGDPGTGAGMKPAHRLFAYSILYLFLLFAVLAVETWMGASPAFTGWTRDGGLNA